MAQWPQSLITTLSIILNSKFPMFLFWGEDLVCFYNDAYRPSLGNNGKHPSALGQGGEACWSEIWPSIKPIIDQVHAGGEANWSEDQLLPIYRNGKMEDVYWTFSYSPVYNESSQVGGVFVTCSETTEKVNTLKQLQQSEDALKFAIDAAELATFDYNPKTNTFKANDRLKAWFGIPTHSRSEIDLEVAINAIAAKDKAIVMAAIEQSLDYGSGGKYDIVYSIIHPVTGAERIVNAKGKCWFNDDRIAYRLNGTLQDVTKDTVSRKKVEQERERTKLAIATGELGVFEVDIATNALTVDARFNDIYGFSETRPREEYVATCHPDDLPIRNHALKEALTTGSFDYESRFTRQDKSERWIKTKGNIIYDEKRQPQKLFGVIQDITDQKNFSESLAKLVTERTLELQRSNDDLLQFAHVTSHDLKEPVRKIKTFNSRLKDEFGEIVPEKGRIYLDKIQHATDRMFTMIDGVLTYSTLNASKAPIEKIDLNDLIKQIETDLEIAIQQKNARLNAAPLPVIEGAGILIYQLFYNLINNSLKFAKADVEPEITFTAAVIREKDKDVTEITIADNGIGFDKAYAEKIFDAFARLHPKDKYEGTGLGLALCRRIAERHHGSMYAAGNTGEGATFTVRLPVMQAAPIL